MSNTTNSLRNYEIRQKLGSGSYGVIYKVYNKIDKSMCVLKQISLTRMSEKARKNVIISMILLGN
jgi:serine/threonine protein kinase